MTRLPVRSACCGQSRAARLQREEGCEEDRNERWCERKLVQRQTPNCAASASRRHDAAEGQVPEVQRRSNQHEALRPRGL